MESYIDIYLRDGNTLNDQTELTRRPVSVELERVMQRVIDSYDVYQKKSHDQFIKKLSVVECFYLTLIPESLFSNYLVQLKQRLISVGDGLYVGNSSRLHVPFTPLSELEFIAFIEHLLTEKDDSTSYSVKGRGVGYKSLEGFITVVRSIHRSAGIPEGICPTYGEKVKAIVKNCFDRYHPEGAPTLDLATFNYKVWVDSDGGEVNLNYDSWNDICKMFFVGAGVFDATTHSIRKSAAVWAARCGAEEYQIREAGRWNSGDTYMIYVKSGKAIASLAASRKDGSLDPIRKIWVFHPTAFLTTLP